MGSGRPSSVRVLAVATAMTPRAVDDDAQQSCGKSVLGT